MEHKGKNRTKGNPNVHKTTTALFLTNFRFIEKEGKLWRSVASRIIVRLVDWLFRIGVVGPSNLGDSRKFCYFRVFFVVDARGEYVESIYKRGRFFVDAIEAVCQSEACEQLQEVTLTVLLSSVCLFLCRIIVQELVVRDGEFSAIGKMKEKFLGRRVFAACINVVLQSNLRFPLLTFFCET